MSGLLDTPLADVNRCGIFSLMEELEILTGVSAQALPRTTLWQYLTLCLYPEGLEARRQKLSGQSLPDEALLNTTLRALSREGSAVFPLCEEIARRNGTTVEFHLGQRLYTYLNSQLPKFERKQRRR